MKDNMKYKRPTDAQLAKLLDEGQYKIMIEGETEPPFSSEHLENVEKDVEGIYVDAATGEPLFTTYDQFSSACGWPSFTKPIDTGCVKQVEDRSLSQVRTEVRSTAGDFHLGHVFTDGPQDRGGLRYCINGQSIRFVPKSDLKVEGYAYLLPYLKKRKLEEEK